MRIGVATDHGGFRASLATVDLEKKSVEGLKHDPPKIVVATEPTELIATDGAPSWQTLDEGELMYIANTESRVVREVKTGKVFVLITIGYDPKSNRLRMPVRPAIGEWAAEQMPESGRPGGLEASSNLEDGSRSVGQSATRVGDWSVWTDGRYAGRRKGWSELGFQWQGEFST